MALALRSNPVRNCHELVSDRQLQCITIQGKINQLKSQQLNPLTVVGALKRPWLKKIIIKNWLLEMVFQFFASAFLGYYSSCKI